MALVVVAAAAIALVLAIRGGSGSAGDSRAARKADAVRAARARTDAVTWIATQVSPSSLVACDHRICGALTGHGFPSSDLLVIKPKTAFPASASVVVMTAAVAHQLGSRIERQRAPAVLASFGSGQARIEIRLVAKGGAAAYQSALRADRGLSRTVGSGLVTSSQITTTGAAKKAMSAGRVDARLLIVITALAAQHPIDILGFGAPDPGASPGLPLRTMNVAASDPTAHLGQAAYVQSVKKLLSAQPARYRPLAVAVVPVGSQRVLQIRFASPTPLGLLTPHE